MASLHTSTSALTPATSNSQDAMFTLMEEPDPNRFTPQCPIHAELTAPKDASSDILSTTQFYYMPAEDGSYQLVEVEPGDGLGLRSFNHVIVTDDNVVEDISESYDRIENVKGREHETKKNRPQQSPKNPYGQFLHMEKLGLIDNSQRLDATKVLAKWKSLSSHERAKYQKMYQTEKDELGDLYRSDIKKNKMTPEKAKEKKLTRNCLRQKNIRKANTLKDMKEKMNINKLKKIILRKTERISELNKKTEELNSELLSLETSTQAAKKLIQKEENAEVIMKKKYKLAFSHHSVCHKK